MLIKIPTKHFKCLSIRDTELQTKILIQARRSNMSPPTRQDRRAAPTHIDTVVHRLAGFLKWIHFYDLSLSLIYAFQVDQKHDFSFLPEMILVDFSM